MILIDFISNFLKLHFVDNMNFIMNYIAVKKKGGGARKLEQYSEFKLFEY